jgi:hypothetical protein
MKGSWKLWIAIIALTFLLGFIFWAQFGYESTIVIYEEAEEVAGRAEGPGALSAEKPLAAPAPEIPLWFTAVQWTAIVAAIGLEIYVIYIVVIYWRRRQHY